MKPLYRRSFLAIVISLSSLALASNKTRNKNQNMPADCVPLQWRKLLESIIGPYLSILEIGKAQRHELMQHEYSSWTSDFGHDLYNAVHLLDKKSISGLRHAYRHRISEDFQQGRITRLNGYILSQTEVEICRWVVEKEFKPA